MPCFTTPKQLDDTCHAHHKMVASRRGNLSPCLCKILTRLNRFSCRLRPVALRPSCLTFGVTSACPMLAIRWLTCLAGAGVPPAGIIDLARPHSPIIVSSYQRYCNACSWMRATGVTSPATSNTPSSTWSVPPITYAVPARPSANVGRRASATVNACFPAPGHN